MFCEHCGTKKEEDALFCQNCGKKTENVLEVVTSSVVKNIPIESQDIFYSKEWRQKNLFVISSLPRMDILIDKDYLYLIKIPKYNNATTGAVVGFILLFILGAFIGEAIGASKDRKKREWYRSAWIDSDGKITSREFMNNLYDKIPLNEIGSRFTFGKGIFTLDVDNKKVIFGKSQVELDRINEEIKKHVL